MLPRAKGFIPSLVALALLLCAGLPLQGQEKSLAKKVEELNQVTGNAVILGEYKILLGEPKEAKELLKYAQKLVKKDKNALSYNAAYILAETAKKFGDVSAGDAFFRACIRKAVKLESTQKIAQSYGGLIDLLYDNGKYAQSAKVCRELLELQTGPGKPRNVLVPVEGPFGRLRYAEDTNYDSVKGLKPIVHRMLIQAITKDGQYDKALKLVDNLIKSSDHWRYRQLKGSIFREAGKYKQAAEVYDDVLSRVIRDKELDPEQREAYEDRFRYLLSNVYVEMGKIGKASEQLETLIKRHPKEAGYYNDLGYIWADHNMHLQKAEQYIRKAIDLDRQARKKIKGLSPAEDKDNGAYLDSMGWVLYRQKKYKEAKKWLEKAVEDKASQHIEIYDHLGDVLMALGERQAAIAAWKRGVELAGNSKREQDRKAAVLKKLKKYSK